MLPKRVLYYGKNEDLPAQTRLRAGLLSLLYERGDLRYIRLGNREIVRRIYVAVRDRNWSTVAPVFSNVVMDVESGSFHITYDVSNRQDEIDFSWKGSISGEADGTITFAMDGEAHSAFWRNRIGFCILVPADLGGCAGVVEHVDGVQESALFPQDFVADQPVQPFTELRAVRYEVQPGVRTEVCFSGDIFEMEDQRNWTDASYKIFSTPLRLPYPVKVEKGSRVSQSVQIRLQGIRHGPHEIRSITMQEEEAPLLAIEHAAQGLPLPALGLGLPGFSQSPADHNILPEAKELDRLRALRLHHLRLDVQPGSDGGREALAQAAQQARALGAGLEVALFVPVEGEEALGALFEQVADLCPPVTAWLCYPAKEFFAGGSPVRQAVAAARRALESYNPAIPFCAGTNADFIFLKRNMPPLEQIEQVTFSICPQVHAFDNASLVETLPVQGDAVRNARRASQGKPVRISPITLRMRFNPYATGPAAALQPGELPPQADARQMSLFGAGWMLGSYKYLAEAGAASITFFETVGLRGVMERAQGSPLPGVFHSLPGGVFPVYHVLADIGEFTGGKLLPVMVSRPLQINGICLRQGEAERVMLANHTFETQSVQVMGLGSAYARKVLDETNALEAMRSPEDFRARPGVVIRPDGGRLALELKPFAITTLNRLAD